MDEPQGDDLTNSSSLFEEQLLLFESNLETPDVPIEPASQSTVKFEIVKNALRSSTDALVMSMPNGEGFKHSARGAYKNGNVSWRCTVREKPVPGQMKKFTCLGRILQTGEQDFIVKTEHTCGGTLHLQHLVSMNAEVKVAIKRNPWKNSKAIVEPIIQRYYEVNPAIQITENNLERVCSTQISRNGTKNPKTLDFNLDPNHFQTNFFRKDVKVDWESKYPARHLLFATDAGVDLLRKAKRWYIDGTFKLVRKPFIQLWTIHSFVKNGKGIKQVPLFYILMSRRQKKDYVTVFKALKTILLSIRLEEIVSDFEYAMWNAARKVFNRPVVGCSFHWFQAVFRKIKELGINNLYRKNSGNYKICRKLLTLNLLPPLKIPKSFDSINRFTYRAGGPLKELCTYIKRQWILSNRFPPSAWSVHGQPVRKNNDVEGLHDHIKQKAHGKVNLSLHQLTSAMHAKAKLVNTDVTLLSQGQMLRHLLKDSASKQKAIMDLWAQYQAKDIRTNILHDKLASTLRDEQTNPPTTETMEDEMSSHSESETEEDERSNGDSYQDI